MLHSLAVTPQPLGQHFLADSVWRDRIIQCVLDSAPEIESRKNVWIEIGAGHGEMTALLAPQVERVIAIEFDPKLLPALNVAAARLGNVSVVHGDILRLDLAKLAGGQPYRVYGSLPYYITSPIVHHLFAQTRQLDAAFIVVQLEVAERLAAHPGTRDYGYLSTFTQFHARTEIRLSIPSGAFRPPPKVDSALVALMPPGERATLNVRDEDAFISFLKLCFAHKRKTLRNNLRARFAAADAERALLETDIAPTERAEKLTLSQFAKLFSALQP